MRGEKQEGKSRGEERSGGEERRGVKGRRGAWCVGERGVGEKHRGWMFGEALQRAAAGQCVHGVRSLE